MAALQWIFEELFWDTCYNCLGSAAGFRCAASKVVQKEPKSLELAWSTHYITCSISTAQKIALIDVLVSSQMIGQFCELLRGLLSIQTRNWKPPRRFAYEWELSGVPSVSFKGRWTVVDIHWSKGESTRTNYHEFQWVYVAISRFGWRTVAQVRGFSSTHSAYRPQSSMLARTNWYLAGRNLQTCEDSWLVTSLSAQKLLSFDFKGSYDGIASCLSCSHTSRVLGLESLSVKTSLEQTDSFHSLANPPDEKQENRRGFPF